MGSVSRNPVHRDGRDARPHQQVGSLFGSCIGAGASLYTTSVRQSCLTACRCTRCTNHVLTGRIRNGSVSPCQAICPIGATYSDGSGCTLFENMTVLFPCPSCCSFSCGERYLAK